MSPEREREPARPPEAFRELLEVQSRRTGPEVEASVLDRLSVYLAELDVWRRTTNLTGRLPPDELATHVLESLLGARLIPRSARVVDVGSGAGLPGVPLAIARPDLAMTLVEPRAKRCAFLRHVVRTLGLGNVQVLETRIEQVGGKTYDVATTRAVGDFAGWLAGARFLSPGGLVLAWATETANLETALGDAFRMVESLPIPGSKKRRIVAFRPAA